MLNEFINSINEDIIYIYAINIFVLVTLVFVFITSRKSNTQWSRVNDYLGTVSKTLNSVRYGDLTKKLERLGDLDSAQLTESVNKMIETLSDRESMIQEYQTELYKQNKLLEAVINSLSDGLVIVDLNYKILRVTKMISDWFEVEGQDLIGKSLLDYIKIPENKSPEKLKDIEILLNNDKTSNYIANSIELKHDGKQLYIVIIKNVTDQMELETLKEDFVATLTHDLKVPIIAEKNMLELFLNETFGEITEKQSIALINMQSSNKELLDLVQTVLETYKFKGKTFRLYKENVLLKSFIEEIIDEMQPIADKNKNSLKFILKRDIRVVADKIQLKRVVKNLIHNAISYGKANSPIEITIGEIPKYVFIKVKDYGTGIAQKEIDKIFHKYYSAAKKFRKIGTGLGLYLAFQIIKAHNGDITVESTEGEYTEFCIKLPATVNESLFYGE